MIRMKKHQLACTSHYLLSDLNIINLTDWSE